MSEPIVPPQSDIQPQTQPQSMWQFNLRTMFLLFLVFAIYFFLASKLGYWIFIPGLIVLLYVGLLVKFSLEGRWKLLSTTICLGIWFCCFLPSPEIVLPSLGIDRTERPNRRQHMNNIRNIAFALYQYENKHGQLPPPYTTDEQGNRLHSWRSLILPNLERNDIYKVIRWDEPWNSPYNQQFHKIQIPVLGATEKQDSQTSYVAVVGPGTAWDAAKKTTLQEIAEGDGTANTLLLIAVPNSGIHWMEPRDLQFDRLNPQKIIPIMKDAWGNPYQLQAVVVFADSHTGSLTTKEVTVENLQALFSINGNDHAVIPE